AGLDGRAVSDWKRQVMLTQAAGQLAVADDGMDHGGPCGLIDLGFVQGRKINGATTVWQRQTAPRGAAAPQHNFTAVLARAVYGPEYVLLNFASYDAVR